MTHMTKKEDRGCWAYQVTQTLVSCLFLTPRHKHLPWVLAVYGALGGAHTPLQVRVEPEPLAALTSCWGSTAGPGKCPVDPLTAVARGGQWGPPQLLSLLPQRVNFFPQSQHHIQSTWWGQLMELGAPGSLLLWGPPLSQAGGGAGPGQGKTHSKRRPQRL